MQEPSLYYYSIFLIENWFAMVIVMRKKPISLIQWLAFLLCVFSVSCATSPTRIDQVLNKFKDHSAGVMVAAHRACWKDAPENSLKSIQDCIDLGVDIVEIDIRRTRDGHSVLMHDQTVDRTTNGQGLLSHLTLSELKDLRLKDRNGQQSSTVTGYEIPTFREALLAAKGRILVNVDAKDDVFFSAIEEAASLGMENQILIKIEAPANDPRLASFDFLKKTNFMPKITQAEGLLGSLVSGYAVYKPDAFEIKAKTEEYLAEGADDIASMGARLWINTLTESPEKAAGHIDALALENPGAHWGRLIELGVNIFQTDEPEALLRYLHDNGLR